MKYNRGSIVEVFCYQCWRCARIVSAKGHNYTVSYDVYPGFTNKDDVEHISVKSIRPCPPQLEISECWVPSDVAEVFHDLSWKMAIVLKDFGLDQFMVRLVGSFEEFEVTKSELRVMQSYKNGEWVVIGKVPSDCKDASCPNTQNNRQLMESHIVSSKTLKRASPCSYSEDDRDKQHAQKLRKSGKEGRRARVPGTSPENRTCGYESSSGIEDHESDAESVCQSGYHEESLSQETDESACLPLHHGDITCIRALEFGERNYGNEPSYVTQYIK